MKDYSNYMETAYGDDAYALRSCLSGKALDITSGVDDDYDEMWRRLNNFYCNPEKLIDSVLQEIKNLPIVRENDSSGFIYLVNTIEKCFLDLKKLGLEREMDTSAMVSHVERLLPRLQMREWTVLKRRRVVNDSIGKPGTSSGTPLSAASGRLSRPLSWPSKA